jgi:hypothetical protein
VLSLTVPRIKSGGPFYASGKDAFVRLDGANKRLSGPELTAWITERSSAKKAAATRQRAAVWIFFNGDKLPLDYEIRLDFRKWSSQRPGITLDFHLPPNAPTRCKMCFGVVTPPFFTRIADWSVEETGPVVLPDGRHLFSSDKMALNLLPGAWQRYEFTVYFRQHVVDRVDEFAIRFFGECGPVDIPFALRMLGLEPLRHEKGDVP